MIAVKPLRQCVLATACLCISLISPLFAQKHAPLPEKLISAQSIYLINDSGDLKAYDKLFSELKKWGRFTIVTARDGADIIAVLTSQDGYAVTVGSGTVVSTGNTATVTGSSVTVPSTYLHLKVFDATTGEPLWSDKTEKWVTSGHAPSKLVSNLKNRMPKTGSGSK